MSGERPQEGVAAQVERVRKNLEHRPKALAAVARIEAHIAAERKARKAVESLNAEEVLRQRTNLEAMIESQKAHIAGIERERQFAIDRADVEMDRRRRAEADLLLAGRQNNRLSERLDRLEGALRVADKAMSTEQRVAADALARLESLDRLGPEARRLLTSLESDAKNSKRLWLAGSLIRSIAALAEEPHAAFNERPLRPHPPIGDDLAEEPHADAEVAK